MYFYAMFYIKSVEIILDIIMLWKITFAISVAIL